MKCPHCDANNPDGLRTCSFCGKDLPIEAVGGESDPADAGISPPIATPSATDDVPTNFGEEVASAYQPSGQSGNVTLLLIFGVLGLLAGIALGAACAGGAFLVNVIHNVLPVFIFVLPLIILALLAISPAVFGVGLGYVLEKGAIMAKSRSPALVGLIGLGCAGGGIILFLAVAENLIPPEGSFLADMLVPFVRLMVAGTINFSWLETPDPVNVPAWLIYGVFGLSSLLALALAFHLPYDKIRSTPFCEQCRKYLRPAPPRCGPYLRRAPRRPSRPLNLSRRKLFPVCPTV